MKYAPKKVFVLENGNYKEITYEEYVHRKEVDKQYAERWFIPIHGCLMETDQKQYSEFYREAERDRYLKKLENRLGLLSIDAFDNEDENGIDFIESKEKDIDQQVEDKLMVEKLRKVLPLLSKEEQLLVQRHYYDDIPETRLAEIYGITQQAISKRIIKLKEKLKKFLEN